MVSSYKRAGSRMLVLALAVLVILGMLLPQTNHAYAEDQTVYHDGTYEGTAEGYQSDITVAVTITDGKIAKVEVVSQQETKSYWRKLTGSDFFNSFVTDQTAEVDAVSGATISSEGVKEAVRQALELAKADPGSPFSQGEGTKDSPYVISSSDKLVQFAETVDEGETYAGKYIVLGSDMDISGVSNWNPIGEETPGSANIFAGNFDGKGHKIAGMTLKGKYTDAADLGLFSGLAEGAAVSNVKITGSLISVKSSNAINAGVLAGSAEKASVSGISADGEVTVKTSNNSGLNAGGVLGSASGTLIINNDSDVEVSASAQGASAAAAAGGVAGSAESAGSSVCVVANNDSVAEVYSSAPQNSEGASAAGIAGTAEGYVWNNYAAGNVTAGGNGSGNANAIAGLDEGTDAAWNYYAKDAVITVEKGDTSEETAAEEGVNAELTKAEMASGDFADTMTDNLAALSKKAKEIGLTGLALNEWIPANDKAVPFGDAWTQQNETESTFAGGNGTKKNPYLIETKDQLKAFAKTVSEGDTYKKKYVKLNAGIDMAGEEWEPIGSPNRSFRGTFDGNGKVIKNLSIGSKDDPMQLGTVTIKDDEGNEKTQTRNVAGFFTSLQSGAAVKNLKMENCGFYGASNAGAQTGLVAGYAGSGVIIDNCEIKGVSEVTCSKGNAFHGGLVGRLEGAAMINCICDVDVKCENTAAYPEAGGLAGMNNGGLIANSCMLGDVVAETGSNNEGYTLAGLLTGYQGGDIVNCYTNGSLETNDDSQFSGLLVGWVRGAARTYLCRYSDKSTLTMAGKKIDPVKIEGVPPTAIPDSEGEKYLGGLTDRVTSYDPSKPDKLAEALNGEFSKFPVDVTEYGVDKGALRGWDLDDDDRVVFGEDNAVARYEMPECEKIPQKENSLKTGTFYGRSKDKNGIVAITVKAGKVRNVDIIKGESSGSEYEEALEKAKEKSIYGDTSSYDKANPNMFGGGSGTKEDPYLISNEAQLRYLAASINEDVSWENTYFKQTADITLENGDWLPIGWGIMAEVKARVTTYAEYPFCGSYDGAGKAIRGLRIGSKDDPSTDPRVSLGAGLFGYTEGDEETNDTPQDPKTRYVELKNIKLADAELSVASDYGTYAGALTGLSENGVRITDCYAAGKVSVNTERGTTYAGGLAGLALRGLIQNCAADTQVIAEADKATVYAGGMFGNDNRATTVNSHALGDVRANSSKGTVYAGGMSGMFAGIRYNCYTKGDVTSVSDTRYAGLINGQLAGIGGESGIYYNSDAKLSVGGKDAEKKANGYSAGRSEQSVVIAKTAAEMSSEGFAKELNDNQAKAKEELTAMHVIVKDINHHGHGMYYAGDGTDLTKWTVEKGIVTLAGIAPSAAGKSNNDNKPSTDNGKNDKSSNSGNKQSADSQSPAKVEKGKTYVRGGSKYRVDKAAAGKAQGAVTFVKAKNVKSASVPKTVRLADGKVYKVTAIGAKAFTGKKIRKVTIGAGVRTIKAKAFAGSKAKTMIVKTKLLKKKSVKGSLKGSKIKMIKVKVGSKKMNRKYVKNYKKIFTKKNAGRKVSVR